MAITMTATLMRRISMRLIACLVLANFDAAAGWAQGPKYPPLCEYMMAPEAEVALAKSAAPENGGGRIRVHVLCGPGSWAGIGRVASSHDGVYAELRELDARRQRAR